MELVNLAVNQDFLRRSSTSPGAAFFEPVPTVIQRSSAASPPDISSTSLPPTINITAHTTGVIMGCMCRIQSHVPVLNKATGQRGAGRGYFTAAGGEVISVSGSAFGPNGLDASFAVSVCFTLALFLAHCLLLTVSCFLLTVSCFLLTVSC